MCGAEEAAQRGFELLGVMDQKSAGGRRRRPRPAAITSSQGKGRARSRPSAARGGQVCRCGVTPTPSPSRESCRRMRVGRSEAADGSHAAEGGGEQAGDDVDEAGGAAVGLHAGDRVVGDVVAGAAQAGADDALRVAGGEAAGLEALGEREHVVVAEGVLQLGERAEREAERVGAAVEAGLDLAAVGVGHWDCSGGWASGAQIGTWHGGVGHRCDCPTSELAWGQTRRV